MASEWLFPTNTEVEEPSDKSRNEELFVFGYHCKLFRDDEQANMVDSGTYMIPWMGDEKLKIDRYDGRGHLYDLRPYDADNLKGQPDPVLSEDEEQIEKLCDEERYLELHTDIAEKNMYEEEEWKRYYESLSEGYQAVGFSYDYGQAQHYAELVPDEPKPNPEEAVFVPPTELQVPPGVHIPDTVKENAIIEKTAKFIAEHGIQMEIVMKTKQSNNPQFQFMHFENHLHPYYKHLIKMIKSKKYIPKSPVKEEPPDAHNESSEGDGGYLHPTLMTTNRASPTPQEVYKPVPMPKVSIHETSYGQLLQSMSKVNKELAEKNREKEVKTKKEVKSEPSDSYSLPACVAQPVYGSSMPPPPGIEPVQLPSDLDIKQEGISLPRTSSPPAQIVPPPPDLQPIIDRMAMYVAKNGEEFAIVVKSKKDARFQFLETWHTHYPYYNFKRHLFQEELDREKKEQEEEERKKEQEKADILARGVKFKLKKAIKEQESSTTLEKKPVFGYDESGDENDDSDSNIMRSKSTNVSGTSTPVKDGDVDSKTSEQLERKLVEQRLKDRLAASAREKLSQVDKEKQIKLERKKKAAMFINLLKSKNGGEEESKAYEQGSQSGSSRDTPVRTTEDSSSSRHKSKHKSRDRSRSRDRDSRSRRSRSRSSSRSKSKKKKRHRSPTPPSAYNVSWRSSARFPPPPPPRYNDIRSRYSRSPSKGRNSRHRSRSRSKGRSSKQRSRSRSTSRSKSKKKKRSKSPKSKKDDSSRRKSSKKKKKRSRSRSVDKKSTSTSSQKDPISKVTGTSVESGVKSPAQESDCCIIEPLEDGETRESTPEPGQITDNSDITYRDSSQRSTPVPPDIETLRQKRKRSSSSDSSRSNSPKLRQNSSRKSHSKSPSKSPNYKISMGSVNGSETASPLSHGLSREVTPVTYMSDSVAALSENVASNDKNYSAGPESSTVDKNVSSYMLDRVRAIIKASREAVQDEDSLLDDS